MPKKTFTRPVGANNRDVLTDSKLVGKIVRVWGKVISVNGTTSFTISDGYGTPVTVYVNGASLPAGFGTTKTAVVTGILSDGGTIRAQSVTAR